MESREQAKKTPPDLQLQASQDSPRLSLKQHAGDAANKWLSRNRSLVLRQTPFWAQGLAALMIGLGTTALCVGIFLRIDEVISVQGQLKSIGGNIEVKTPAGGKVAEVMFSDGAYVEKGDKLIRFDTTKASQEKTTLKRLIDIETKQLDAKLRTLFSQSEMLSRRKEVLERRIETKATIIQEMTSLVEQGGFQRLQFLQQKDELFQLENELEELSEQKNQLKLQSDDVRLQSSKSVSQMKSQLKLAELQLQYQNVIAPIAGVIFDPQASLDGVLQPGERIVSIVPQQGLYAEVYVPNIDIGYIKVGQSAKVRVDAFPFSRYGELPGSVIQISADALKPDPNNNFYRYPVKLDLARSYLESDSIKIPLKSGMSISTNLKLRDKRVISLLSDMLVDQTDSVRSIRQQ